MFCFLFFLVWELYCGKYEVGDGLDIIECCLKLYGYYVWDRN